MSERTESYQVMIDGKTVVVASLTLEQALENLCDAIDVIEEIDEAMDKNPVSKIISNWRNDVK